MKHSCKMGLFLGLVIAVAASAYPQNKERLTLEAALAEALAGNQDLLAERARMPVVDAALTNARLRPNPVLTITSDHLDLLGTGFSEINGAGPAEISLATEFTWERSGKRDRRIDLARREREIAEYELQDEIRLLTFDVQSAFVDMLLAQDSLALARDNLTALTRISQINADRVQSGDLAEVESMRIQLAVLALENEVSQAELGLRAARTRLGLLMGRTGPASAFEAEGALRHEPSLPKLEAVEQVAQELRPDLQAARAGLERAKADLRLQLANARGDWTFGTEYRRQQGINANGNSLGFITSLPLPFSDRNQGEVARARAEATRAEVWIAAVRNNVIAEIRSAFDQGETARSQLVRIESRMLPEAIQVREIMRYSYERGEASLLQFLDSERAYNETMQGLAKARAEYARSLYLIEAVSAKGVKP